MLFSARLLELPTLSDPRTRVPPPSLTQSGSLRTQLASVRERKAKHLTYFLPLGLNSFEFCFLILKMEIMLLSPPGWYVLNEITLVCTVYRRAERRCGKWMHHGQLWFFLWVC